MTPLITAKIATFAPMLPANVIRVTHVNSGDRSSLRFTCLNCSRKRMSTLLDYSHLRLPLDLLTIRRCCASRFDLSYVAAPPETGLLMRFSIGIGLGDDRPRAYRFGLTGRQKSPRTAGTCYTMSMEFVQSLMIA